MTSPSCTPRPRGTMQHRLRRVTCSVCAFALLGLAAPATAQGPHPDAPECKDSSVLSRFPGCWIEACEAKDFDALDIFRETEKPDVFDVTKGTPVEGQTTVIEYSCPASVSALQIARNAEGALRTAGYSLI